MANIYFDNFDADSTGIIAPGWTNISSANYQVGTVNPFTAPNSFGDLTNVNGDVALYTTMTSVADMIVSYVQRVNLDGSQKGGNVGLVARSTSTFTNAYLFLKERCCR